MKRVDVAAFVDWQSQLINSGAVRASLPGRKAEIALQFVTGSIAKALRGIDEHTAYFVKTKIYHGWHTGLTPTKNLEALQEVMNERRSPTRVDLASFNWVQPYGSILSGCYDHRLHRKLRVHLPNTLRSGVDKDSSPREKMVDSALICDVLDSAKQNPSDIRIILAEDDDLVPAAFTAEYWSKDRGGRTIILRSRGMSDYINMDGIYRKLERASDH